MPFYYNLFSPFVKHLENITSVDTFDFEGDKHFMTHFSVGQTNTPAHAAFGAAVAFMW